jgi:hypothetical protein
MRALVLILILANAAFFAWSHGLLADWGFAPNTGREPQRVTQQVRPEALRVLRPAEAARAESPAAPTCLQALGFEEAQAAVLRRALEDLLPAGSWQLLETGEAARWIVYMGKFGNAQAKAAKRTEVAALKLKIEDLQNADLEPGFSLGSHANQRDAEAALAELGRRGVRTAKVVLERPSAKRSNLKLPAVDDTLRPKLEGLLPALGGKSLTACG